MLVVDASVAVKFVFREPGSIEAREIISSTEALVAPDWILPEIASALWNKVKYSELLEVHAGRSFASIPDFFSRLFSSTELVKDAFTMSFRLQHSVYDCIYLALAMREDATLITADKKFFRKIDRLDLVKTRLLEWAE